MIPTDDLSLQRWQWERRTWASQFEPPIHRAFNWLGLFLIVACITPIWYFVSVLSDRISMPPDYVATASLIAIIAAGAFFTHIRNSILSDIKKLADAADGSDLPRSNPISAQPQS
jgi:hypothetical protein